MERIAIGLGAITTALVSLLATSVELAYALLVFGGALTALGLYQAYVVPNLWLDRTVTRWLGRRYWEVRRAEAPKDRFYFALWAKDDAGREVLVSREREQRGILAFTAKVDLDAKTVSALGGLPAPDQQRLYEDLHVLLASMGLGYLTPLFTSVTVQDALPLDHLLSEHAVDLKAKGVSNGYAAARSLMRRAVLN